MVDFHTHILPCVDDGSADTEQSVRMLDMLYAQGVDTVCATPHFLPDKISPEGFLAARAASYERLKPRLTRKMPEMRLGAEVWYYRGISGLKELKKLCIEDSGILLLEMPPGKWGEYDIRELIDLNSSGELTVMLAHIERYPAARDKKLLDRLCRDGILLQVNASFFGSFRTRGKALGLLESEYISAVGSDCHNTETRPPDMDTAIKTIKKRFSGDFLRSFDAYTHSLLTPETNGGKK